MLGFGALGQFALGQPGQNATANGATLSVTASLIAGVSSGAANVSGATVSAVSSIIAGTPAADAGAVGSTVSASASLVDGAATGAATASGTAVVVSAALLAGSATGTGTSPVVFGTGAPLPRVVSRRNAEAPGDLLVAVASLRPGRAATVSLLPGEATGSAGTGDIVRLVYAELAPGSAAGELNLHDDELMLLLEAA